MFSSKHPDVFVSHAVEDKDAIADALCVALKKANLSYWYSSEDLVKGGGIAEEIHAGIKSSSYGIAILSPQYISKSWTKRELHIMLARETRTEKIVFPVLMGVTPSELAKLDAGFPDRYAFNTNKGVSKVIAEVVDTIKARKKQDELKQRKRFLILGICAFLFLLGTYSLVRALQPSVVSETQVKEEIKKRMDVFNQKLLSDVHQGFLSRGGQVCSIDSLRLLDDRYQRIKSSYQNEYEFTNGLRTIKSKKNVARELRLPEDEFSLVLQYGIKDATYYLLQTSQNGVQQTTYQILNKQPEKFSYSILGPGQNGSSLVEVTYQQNIRLVEVDLTQALSRKSRRVIIYGYLPKETYRFDRSSDGWRLTNIH